MCGCADELLEILAQTKNVQAVQPHMGKCFDGIRKLDFGDDPKAIDIHAMISGQQTPWPVLVMLRLLGLEASLYNT
jgi:hypothetical protein